MSRLVSIQSIVVCSLSLLLAAGCGTEQSGDSSGSIRVNLELSGGVQIDEVSYVISGNNIPPIADTIDTSPLGATASVEVRDIPVGEEDYLIEMMATSVDGGTTCEGSAPFNVTADELTELAVLLMCKPGERFGGVGAEGSFNICEELPRIVVSVAPLQTPVGSTINVSAQPVEGGDSLSYLWTGTGGSFADPTAASTTYTCGVLGNQTITLEVTDDEGCDETWTVNITCVGDAGECTNAGDAEVYSTVQYMNFDGFFTGTEAVSEIAADCVFGTAPNLVSNGCGSEVTLVLGNNTPENRAALAACIEACIADQGVDLSDDCLDCYGDSVTCNTAFCAAPCASSVNAPACINCRCDNGCPQGFDTCSGLPGGGECDGGTGGTGGNGCQTTCGLGNSVDPGWTNDEQVLDCTVMGIGIGFEWNLVGQVASGGAPVIGENTYDLQLEAIISDGTVNLVLALADSATITGTNGTVAPSAGTTDTNTADIDLLNTPCEVCFVRDQEIRVPLPVVQDTWNLNDGTTQSLSLPDVTIEIDAAGLALILSTTGEDPACLWNTVPPEIDFTVPQ